MSVLRRATVPRAPSPRRSVVGRGLAGVLLSFAVLATLQALTIHPFHPPDEMSHVGYALEVGHGRLPTIETPIPGREIPLLQHKVDNSRPANRTIWTANHPPLYYLVSAVPLRLGVELGHPTAGIRVARLVNVAISLAGLVLIVLLARELVPARPELWVGAAGLAALVPVFVQTSAIVYNDALMVALTTAVLLLIARVLRWGPTRRRLVLLAVLAAAAALTRASGLVVVAVAGVAAVVAVWRQDGRPGRSRAVRAIAAGGAIVVTATAAAGWFYLRNRHLYHSATGTGPAGEVLPAEARDGPADAAGAGLLAQPGPAALGPVPQSGREERGRGVVVSHRGPAARPGVRGRALAAPGAATADLAAAGLAGRSRSR